MSHRCALGLVAGLVGSSLALALMAAGAAAAGTPTCSDFLKISTLPRVAAMGEAAVAVGDATWAEVNPANLTSIEGSLVTFTHTAWFQDISLETMSLGTSSGRHGFGVALSGLHTEPLEEYDSEDVHTGQFRYYDFLVAATYARRVLPSLTVGGTAKVIYERIGWDSASGLAFDLGLVHARQIGFLRGEVSGGLVMRNLGSKMGYFEEKYDLPLTWQGGLAYRAGWLPSALAALVAVDYRTTREGERGVLVGAELGFMRTFTLRAGAKSTSGVTRDGGDATVGLGARIRNLTLDYAYADFGDKLGATHRVSLGISAGAILPFPEASR
ncbi:MAG: PorV/PorQ family protein [bacterium]